MAIHIVSKVKQLHVLQGIYPYKQAWLSGDVLAGLTLAAVAIPECMGYAKIAGMPIVAGLYTLLLPVLAFAALGSSRHLVVGADSATAAIMFAGLGNLGITGLEPGSSKWVALAGALALLTGLALLLARVLGLGFLANFLSQTVLVGFLTGVGLQVSLRQLPDMFGVEAPATSTTENILARFSDLENNPDETISPYLEFNVEGKLYYFTPGGFLYRRDHGTEEVGGFFCGYLTDEVWRYRTGQEPEGVEKPKEAKRRSWWRRWFGG